MWKLLAKLKPSMFVLRKSLYFLCVTGIAVAAFFWGRRCVSQTRPGQNAMNLAEYTPAADYSRRVVATIFGNITISREELGEYLIARYGQDRIDNLVNRRIIEKACHDAGIYVTDTEVETQLAEDLRALGKGGVTVRDFETKILRPYNKTLYEWKEDVLRPQLYMTKLARPEVRVDNTDIQKLFDARYGPMVKVRMIVLAKDRRSQWNQVWEEVRNSEAKFIEHASNQFMEPFRAKAGEAPPVHKNFGDVNIERAAFRLQVGEVSNLIELEDHTAVILRCEGHIPARTDVNFDRERGSLYNDVYRLKLNQKIPELMKRLRDKAAPTIPFKKQIDEDDLKRQVERELNPRAQQQMPGPMPQSNILPASYADPSKMPGPPPGTAVQQPAPPAAPVPAPGTLPLPPSPPTSALPPAPNKDGFAPVPITSGLDQRVSPITGLPIVTPPVITPIIP